MRSFKITQREFEVLQLIAEGFNAPEIANQLYLSPYTINDHRKSLIRKLNARNVANMVSISFRTGLLQD